MNDFHAQLANSSTLTEILHLRAIQQPEQIAYTFLLDGELEQAQLTYGELEHRARTIGAGLQRVGAYGERVLLLYPPGIEYIASFFGCLYAGMIAVPVYPPRIKRPDPRLQTVVADAQPRLVLTTQEILSNLENRIQHTKELQAIHWLSAEDLSTQTKALTNVELESETLAFLQYTSGSTTAPKGVMLTHHNLINNLRAIHQRFELTNSSRGLIWLPPYHDMGLIGGILTPLYGGFPVTLMSPVAFVERPFRWLQAISRFRATVSGGPNFAYELCADKVTPEERATLDLSSWEVAFTGAEPIRPQTLERFAATFEVCGFRREAFYPCYGLAEATLMVSGGRKAVAPLVRPFKAAALERNQVVEDLPENTEARMLVSCGQALQDHQIVIVDPQSLTECACDHVGEIWVSGLCVARGYWNRPEETEYAFRAHLADTGQGPFLRTGDLGFLKGGNLYITGRLKDLIVIRGRNYYPQDIEFTVEQSHSALQRGGSAAFSVEIDGEERLIIVQEVKRHYPKTDIQEIVSVISKSVSESHELQAYQVILVKPGSIPKTTSGKVQRHVCRAAFLQNRLEVVAQSPPSITLADQSKSTRQSEKGLILRMLMAVSEPAARHALLALYLQEQVSHIFHRPLAEIDLCHPLSAFGLDSLRAIELNHEVEVSLGLALSATSFLQDVSINQIASQMLDQLTEVNPSRSAERSLPLGEIFESPLSHGQRALWFLNQLAPDSAAYNLAHAVRISSELDVPALQRAFQVLAERHPILRVTFAIRDEEPIQRFHTHREVDFHWEDVSAWDEAFLHSRLTEEAHRPFDMNRGPLLRVGLFTRSAEEHILLVVVHHIIADLWSLAVFVSDLGKLYESEKTGAPIVLPVLTSHYADFVRRQSEMLSSLEGERLWTFWKEQLGGKLPILNLYTDRPRPPIQTYQGATQFFQIDAQLTKALKALSQTQQVTLYVTLMTAFQVLLYRYTGQEDILIGSPTAGRNRADLAGLLGYFVNPVVVRADLSCQPTFLELLKRTRQAVLTAFEFQDFPFNLLVERLRPFRDLSRSPFFQVMFVLQQTPWHGEVDLAALALGKPRATANLGGLTLESISLERYATQFDLTLAIAETESTLEASLQYSTDLFDAATMVRLAGHFETLLRAIVTDPEQRLASLALLPKTEYQQLLVEWNETRRVYPQDRCIHELFEFQATQTPETVALVYGDQHLTYQELNRRASQLAHYLRKHRIGPEAIIGVCLERSVEMIVALLGVLKAGGAYVPLDPSYPPERLAFILQDSQATILLAQAHLLKRLPVHHAELVCLEDAGTAFAFEESEKPINGVSAQNLAYVIYTSGSTGRPKGVAIQHNNTVAFIHWAQRLFKQELESDVLAATSICFDLSVFEIFGVLSSGGTLVLVQNALQLSDCPSAHRVRLVNSVPSAAKEWLQSGGLPESVRVINLAGEPLTQEVVEQLYLQKTIERVYDLYGPSETTTYSTCALREIDSWPSIGRPIDNTQVYLLDAYLTPVPLGVAGEAYLGGEGVTRGYLNRPELTAERFIPNQFSRVPGARLYRTGDLCRYRADGNLEFLGRVDRQVKVRGYRVELSEVESILRQHPAVREAVVMTHQGQSESGQLVGYVVFAGERLSVDELRDFLQDQLPDYMVPSLFMVLDRLPLTPSGKVDWKSLPIPDSNRPAVKSKLVLPRNALEESLSQVWAQLLELDQVGVEDNFFSLGGHSLLATRLVSRLRIEFQVEISIQQIFKTPTIAQLARQIEEIQCWAKSNKPDAPTTMLEEGRL